MTDPRRQVYRLDKATWTSDDQEGAALARSLVLAEMWQVGLVSASGGPNWAPKAADLDAADKDVRRLKDRQRKSHLHTREKYRHLRPKSEPVYPLQWDKRTKWFHWDLWPDGSREDPDSRLSKPHPWLKGRNDVGCDIHAWVETRTFDKNGKPHSWEIATLGEFFIRRDYTLFAYLAGVRTYDGIEPIVAPRGWPGSESAAGQKGSGVTDAEHAKRAAGEVSPDLKEIRERWGSDLHTPSWLTAGEWTAACVAARMKAEPNAEAFAVAAFANSLDASDACDEVRVVFAFDN